MSRATKTTKPPKGAGDRLPREAPTWNEDAEQCVLSAIFMDNTASAAARLRLEPEHFYAGQNRRIFAAMCRVLDRGAVVDPVSVSHELAETHELESVGGKDYLGYLIDVAPTAANIAYHAEIVRGLADRRALIATLEESAALLRSGDLALKDAATRLQSTLLPIAVPTAREGFVHIADDLWPFMENLEKRAKGEIVGNAILTGYPEIDEPTGGFQRGELVFLAGVPGGLKSAAAMNIAVNVVRDSEYRVGAAVVSAEMKRWKLLSRNLARVAQVPFHAIRTATVHDNDWPRLARAAGEMSRWPLWVDETPRPTLADTAAKCRHLKSKHPEIALIVVDFIQLMQRGMSGREEENRALELTDISYGLAGLGKEIDAVLLALCQVDATKVGSRQNKHPQLEDLRWSQGMREAGDGIGLCYRAAMYEPDALTNDTLEINFGKMRDAEPFTVLLNWIGQYMQVDSPRRRARTQHAGA